MLYTWEEWLMHALFWRCYFCGSMQSQKSPWQSSQGKRMEAGLSYERGTPTRVYCRLGCSAITALFYFTAHTSCSHLPLGEHRTKPHIAATTSRYFVVYTEHKQQRQEICHLPALGALLIRGARVSRSFLSNNKHQRITPSIWKIACTQANRLIL